LQSLDVEDFKDVKSGYSITFVSIKCFLSLETVGDMMLRMLECMLRMLKNRSMVAYRGRVVLKFDHVSSNLKYVSGFSCTDMWNLFRLYADISS